MPISPWHWLERTAAWAFLSKALPITLCTVFSNQTTSHGSEPHRWAKYQKSVHVVLSGSDCKLLFVVHQLRIYFSACILWQVSKAIPWCLFLACVKISSSSLLHCLPLISLRNLIKIIRGIPLEMSNCRHVMFYFSQIKLFLFLFFALFNVFFVPLTLVFFFSVFRSNLQSWLFILKYLSCFSFMSLTKAPWDVLDESLCQHQVRCSDRLIEWLIMYTSFFVEKNGILCCSFLSFLRLLN